MSGVLPATKLPRALVVEDDPDLLALLGSHLLRLGCQVTLVATGEEALTVAAAEPPDLAVIDILLPGMDGRHLLDAIRADERTSGCRVVTTTVLDPEDVGRSCDAVLAKPFSRRDVDRVLGRLVRDLRGEGR